ncbi:glutathione S-transferase family protein [Pseudoxanthomonas japonensis]|nr:glutathione S-transferase family protein [Pseudoxanthomonas japonensis]
MDLVLYYHPLASFCHKVLIALYEHGTPFEGVIVRHDNADSLNAFLEVWPVGKMPVLRDVRRGAVIPESSIVVEYLDQHYPGLRPMLPTEPEAALQVRLWDRFFDHYVHQPVQKVVIDRLRGDGEHDARGVAEALATLDSAYAMLEKQLAGREWITGDTFSLADCSASPALFYAGIVHPFPPGLGALAAYFERLMARPSVRRTYDEARPYFDLFPYRERIPARFLRPLETD